jgi:hypothetical protein
VRKLDKRNLNNSAQEEKKMVLVIKKEFMKMTKKMLSGLATVLFLGIMGLMVFAEDEFKPNVDFKGSRLATGYLDSGKNGSYQYGSFQMPDAKLRLNWQMSPDVTVVTRMSIENATFNSLDYFYMDYRNILAQASPSLKDGPFNPTIRMGRIKLDVGEETWADNPEESIVVSNSASIVKGYGQGLELFDTLKKEVLGVPIKWSLSLTDGTSVTGADNNQAKATNVKIGALPIPELYVSGTYYNSGQLGVSTGHVAPASAEESFAGLSTAPTNATLWTRTIKELDLRYDFQPGKENRLNPGAPAWSDSKGYVRAAYGQFADDGSDKMAPIVKVTNREGTYYFVEGCYNATEKLYLGVRESKININKSTLFYTLNGVNANDYTRTSIGVGYRLTDNTHVKIEDAVNSAKVPTGTKKPEINQIALLFTTKF